MKKIITLCAMLLMAVSVKAIDLDSLNINNIGHTIGGVNFGTTLNDASDPFADGNISYGIFFGGRSQKQLEFKKIYEVSQNLFILNFSDYKGESENKFSLMSFQLSNVKGKAWEFAPNHMLSLNVGNAITWTNIDLESEFGNPFPEGYARISDAEDDYLTSTNFGQSYKWGITYTPVSNFSFDANFESNHVLHHFLPYKFILSRALYGLGDEVLQIGTEALFGVNNYSPILDFIIRGAYFCLIDNINKKEMYGPYSGSPTFHYNQFKISMYYLL